MIHSDVSIPLHIELFMLLIFTLPSHPNGLAEGNAQEGTHEAVCMEGPGNSMCTSHIPLPRTPSSIITTPTCLADQLCDQGEPEEDWGASHQTCLHSFPV